MTETYQNGDYLTVQEECFLELSKTLNKEEATKTTPSIAIYGLEMQNRGYKRMIKISNEVITEFSSKERNRTDFDREWNQHIISSKKAQINTLNRLIEDNNELIKQIQNEELREYYKVINDQKLDKT